MITQLNSTPKGQEFEKRLIKLVMTFSNQHVSGYEIAASLAWVYGFVSGDLVIRKDAQTKRADMETGMIANFNLGWKAFEEAEKNEKN